MLERLKIICLYYPRWLIEFILFILIIVVSNVIGFTISSYIFGKIFGFLGPKLPFTKRIEQNLRFIYPLMEESFVQTMSRQIWINTGRFVGETPIFFIRKWKYLQKFVQYYDISQVINIIKSGKSVILISSHIGNWWLFGKLFQKYNLTMHSIYRAPNNPLINLVYKANHGERLKKHTSDMRKIIPLVKGGNIISIFQDHRDRDGIICPLLGKNCATSTFFAKLAIKYNAYVIYTSAVRTKDNPTKFIIECKEVYNPNIDNLTEEELTIKGNQFISQDISENREQWFWLHKRWKMNKND